MKASLANRVAAPAGWTDGRPPETAVAETIDGLLQDGLSFAEVATLSVLNNPRLQLAYESLGVAQADLLQASMLKNPSVGASIGFPVTKLGMMESEVSLVGEFIDALMLPARTRVATEEYYARISHVSHEVLDTARQALHAAISLAAHTELLRLRREDEKVAALMLELAQRQLAAGGANQWRVDQLASAAGAAIADRANAELQKLIVTEALNQQFGFARDANRWTLSDALPLLPAEALVVDDADELAAKCRLDLEAARRQVAATQQALVLAKTWRWFGRVDLGLHSHQDANGPQLFGPTLSIELPLFDQRQAYIARVEALLRSAVWAYNSLEIEVRAQARISRARAAATWEIARTRLRAVVVPTSAAEQQAVLMQNAMVTGPYQVFESKRASLAAAQSEVEARADYFRAVVDLSFAVGGKMAMAPQGPTPKESVPHEPTPHRHH